MAEQTWATKLKEHASAPWWGDLSLEEKQANIEDVIGPEHEFVAGTANKVRNPFYGRPDIVDELRPDIQKIMDADVPKPTPFAATPAGKAVHFVLDPRVKLPISPEQAGDKMLAETGSPAIAAATKIGREFGEGFTSLLSLVTPGIPSIIRGVRGVFGRARPAAPAASTVIPGSEAPGNLTERVLPATQAGQPNREAALSSDALGGAIATVKEGKPFGMPQLKSGRVFGREDVAVPNAAIVDVKGVKKPVRVSAEAAQDTVQLTDALNAQLFGTVPKSSKSAIDVIGTDAKFAVPPVAPIVSTGFKSDTVINAAQQDAKKAGYYGTDLRKRFKENAESGAPLADNLQDPAESLTKTAPPGFWAKQWGSVVQGKQEIVGKYAFRRANDAVIDVIERFGPDGAATAKLAHHIYDTHEAFSMTQFAKLDAAMTKAFGKQTAWTVDTVNPFTVNATQMYNITAAEHANLVNVLYTSGKIAPLNDKVKAAAQAFFDGTRTVNEHPGMAGTLVHNPLTGASKPIGKPTMFFPNQSIDLNGLANIQMLRSEAAFKHAVKDAATRGETLTKKDWNDRLTRIAQAREGELEPYFAGVQEARLFDAADYGLPYDVLKKGGYETDVMRAFFRYVSKASLYGERQLAKEEMSILQSRLETQFPTTAYPRQSIDIIMGQGMVDLSKSHLRAFNRIASEFNNATLLQLAGISSLPQTSFAVAQAGPVAAAKGLSRYLADTFWRADRLLPEKGGALYSHYMQQMSNPNTRLGVLAQGSLTATGFPLVDRVGRSSAAYIGAMYVTDAAKVLATAERGSKQWARAAATISELHLDAKSIMANGGRLTEDELQQGAMVFANQTMGRSSAQGLPRFAVADNPYLATVLQFKKFLLANTAEMSRLIRNSPDAYTGIKRALTLAIGVEASGELVNDVLYMIRKSNLSEGQLANPFDTTERGAKEWKKLIHTPLGARLMENAITGVGTVWSGILMAGLPESEHLVASLAGPTATTIAKVGTDALKFVAKEHEGISTSHLLEDVERRVPIAGPVMAGRVRDRRKQAQQNPLALPDMSILRRNDRY